jgi:hypothetical protein
MTLTINSERRFSAHRVAVIGAILIATIAENGCRKADRHTIADSNEESPSLASAASSSEPERERFAELVMTAWRRRRAV